MYHKQAIENSPLQAYASALIFSPAHSLIRGLFKQEEPKWITIKSPVRDEWGACLQTLEGHSDWIRAVAFSPNGRMIASLIPGSTLEVLAGVGHMFWWEQPATSAELIRGHALATTSG